MLKIQNLILIMMCYLPVNAWSTSHELLFVKGKVELNGKKARSKMNIKVGDKISTSANGLAIVRLDNGSRVKVEQSSSFTLAKYNKKGDVETKLHYGQMFFKVLRSKVKNLDKNKKKKAQMAENKKG